MSDRDEGCAAGSMPGAGVPRGTGVGAGTVTGAARAMMRAIAAQDDGGEDRAPRGHCSAGAGLDERAGPKVWTGGETGGWAGGWIALGTAVLTLEGALPVEHLAPGDRIVTRAGAAVLQALETRRRSGPMIRVRGGTLGHGRPEQDLLLTPASGVLLRDWRAKALYGQASVVVPVSRLVDGEHVARVDVTDMPVFGLRFGGGQPETGSLRMAQIVLAGAAEVAMGPAQAPAPA